MIDERTLYFLCFHCRDKEDFVNHPPIKNDFPAVHCVFPSTPCILLHKEQETRVVPTKPAYTPRNPIKLAIQRYYHPEWRNELHALLFSGHQATNPSPRYQAREMPEFPSKHEDRRQREESQTRVSRLEETDQHQPYHRLVIELSYN